MHGVGKAEKYKKIKIRNDLTVNAIDIALELLRYLIITISKKFELLNTDKLDLYFLCKLNKLKEKDK